MPDRLRSLWDFNDLDGSEQRFRKQFEEESSGEGKAEVLTQLARVHGLRGDFGACEETLKEAEALAGESAIARVRIDLERGLCRDVATGPEARRIYRIGEFYQSPDETLARNGFAPNRQPGQKGFLLHA